MDSNNNTRSGKLVDLYQRFRQSKSVSPLPDAAESNQSETFKRPNRAAVLICLFEEGNDVHVILTKRSSKLSSYSGEVSLPGGRRDEEDRDDIETALREAKEEIGLDPGLVDVVTVLEPFITKGNVTVVPVIGILWDKQSFNPVPNAEEVESIFYAPLEMFLKPLHSFTSDNRIFNQGCLNSGTKTTADPERDDDHCTRCTERVNDPAVGRDCNFRIQL
ncbi:nudix hydrolase 15, mitochondrial-like isoform X2 [Cynara cardunculus var. scolymus]|uniref:nudix hydrolase 15, mitochondrial-like isoform X2 n=1 Tax=Cynara cardunculus var. scolymus TaxID=59895 RepID=UPI000D62DD74|nr:nudix hydrolase 15, mitochondrial-like isoform X2 [Cynara cardunculus var. scolymus]